MSLVAKPQDAASSSLIPGWVWTSSLPLETLKVGFQNLYPPLPPIPAPHFPPTSLAAASKPPPPTTCFGAPSTHLSLCPTVPLSLCPTVPFFHSMASAWSLKPPRLPLQAVSWMAPRPLKLSSSPLISLLPQSSVFPNMKDGTICHPDSRARHLDPGCLPPLPASHLLPL